MATLKRGRSTATVDDHVGGRIRDRRITLGLTQQQLAEMIGVSYQQAHKYERGTNRVSAGRLFEIARALSAPISYFYEGVGEQGPQQITLHQRMQLEDGHGNHSGNGRESARSTGAVLNSPSDSPATPSQPDMQKVDGRELSH